MSNRVPHEEELGCKLKDIDKAGLYLHIPFCRQICPYCPYNKEMYNEEKVRTYTKAVKNEIDIYAGLLGNIPITSLYIGGGTPTTMLYHGLEEILDHIFKRFNVMCDVHMESHPNDLSTENLDHICGMGVEHLSIGVEALRDRHLRLLKRPYTANIVMDAVYRAASRGFTCLNTDFIFTLPGQTGRDGKYQ